MNAFSLASALYLFIVSFFLSFIWLTFSLKLKMLDATDDFDDDDEQQKRCGHHDDSDKKDISGEEIISK